MAFKPLGELINSNPVERPAPRGVVAREPRFVERGSSGVVGGIVARELRFMQKGALVGFVTLEILAWRLAFKCQWFRKDGREWIGLPSERYEKDGKAKYRNLVEFTDKEAAERFQVAAVAAVKAIAGGRE